MKRDLRLAFIYVSVVLLSFTKMAEAQIPGNPQFKGLAPQQPAIQKSSSRLHPHLQELYDQYAPDLKKNIAPGKLSLPPNAMNKFLQIRGNTVLVDITVKGEMNAARSELASLGFQVTGNFGRVLSGFIPISALPKLDSTASLQYARPAYKPMHQPLKPPFGLGVPAFDPEINASLRKQRRPLVVSQGDTAILAYKARRKYHIDGSGVKVGVLSDSYNNLGGADTGVKEGVLPGPGNPFGYKKPVQVLQDLPDLSGADEGRALLEIVHSLAPGAELAFTTAFTGQAGMAQGILDLRQAGCDIIADDIIYYAEPFFQDGLIAQAIDSAKHTGATYFSSAGNQSVRSYESDYRGSTFEPFGPGLGTAHNFSAPGDPPRYYQPVYCPPFGLMITSLQWNQPSFTASGVGCQTDLDVYLLDTAGNIVALAIGDERISGDPMEIFGFINFTNSSTFYMVITNFAGPDPTRVKYVWFGDGAFYLTNPPVPGILAPTIIGHAKAEGAIATGAAFYLNTPPYGVDTPMVEPYSSVGGVANYFDTKGNSIPPLIRKKPEIVAPDGVSTSFFGQILPQLGDSFPHFFGTSAAVAHGAAVGALMLQAEKLHTLSPDEIRGVMTDHTWAMNNLYPPGLTKGFNFNTGYGLVKADKAVGEVKFPHQFIDNLKLEATCSNDPASTRNWKINNPNPFPVAANWQLIGTDQKGSILVQPGDTVFTTATLYFQGTPLPSIAIIDWQDNFEFPHFDLEWSTWARCGKDEVAINNSDKQLASASTLKTAAGLVKGKGEIAEVYPNPSSGVFRLYLDLKGLQPVDVELYSVDGIRLQSKKVIQSNGVIDIDASGYRPGTYLLKVAQGEFFKTIKLIRQ